MTAKSERNDIRIGMNLGAGDYIVKPFSSAELMNSVQARLNRDETLRNQRKEMQTAPSSESLNDKENELFVTANKRLTPSELRILTMVSENKSTLEIAKEPFISHKTVENHRANITVKLGIKGHLSLLRFSLNYKSLMHHF